MTETDPGWDASDVLKGKIKTSLKHATWTKAIALKMIFVFLFEFVFLPVSETGSLFADPFDKSFEDRNKAKGRLESYYNAAEKAKDTAEWQTVIDSGKRILGAEWEANANAEIEKELKKFTGNSAGREEERKKLQDLKQTASDKWEQELSQEILEKRGSWKANLKKQDFDAYFTTEKKKEIRTALENLVKAANVAKDSTNGDSVAKLGAWDDTIAAGLTGAAGIRALWEDQISQIKTNVLGTASELTGAEKTEFEKKLGEIELYYRNYFSLEENGVKLPARQSLIQGLNRDTDIAIAQETDPTKLTELLIEKTRQQLDPATGQLLNSLDEIGTIPTSFDDITGVNAQEKILRALQDGQALWDEAIERLVVKKLEYDRVAEDKRIRNEDQWSRAYYALLDAQAKWNRDVNKQIEDGLKKWDESELKLKENKQKAVEELNRYLTTSQEQYVAHINGLQGTLLSSSDTIASIVSNIAWYQDQIDKENKKSPPDSGMISTYTIERDKWAALQNQFRQYVASVQNMIHDEDMRGANGGAGILDDDGTSSDPYLYSTAEFEYRLAKAELAEIEKKKNRAQAVVDYAEANVNVTDMTALQTGLDSAKSDYETKQTAYLNLLQELNGSSPVVGGTTGTDPNSGSNSGTSAPPPAATVLSELDAAKKNADEKRKALSIAQAELENARKRFDEAKQLQILVLNNSPEFLGSIGSLNTDAATYDPNKPNSGIKYEIYQADLQIAEAREKLKDNEKVYFSKNYDRTNAARTEDFFGDLWNRIQSFETSKEKLSLLEGAVSGTGKTLLEKVNDLLKPDNTVLVTVFGNQGAAQIKAQLQGLTDALGKKVKDEQNNNVEKEKLPYAIEKYAASLDPILAKSDELLVDFEDADKNQYQQYVNGIGNISSFLTSFASTYNLDGNYLEIGNFNIWKTGLSDALGDWNENLTAFQTAKTEFSQALSTYKTYAAAHPNTESTLEYQMEIQKLTAAFSKYQEKTADLEEYWDDLSTRSQHLKYEALDRIQRAKTLVDMSTLDLTTRKNLKTQLDGFNSLFVKKDSSGKEIPDDMSALITATGNKFGTLGNTFSDYSNRYSYYRNTIDERSAIVDGMTSVLIQALETQRASVTAGKAQLGFLLDENGDIDDLQNTVAGVEETAKTEAARLDARIAEILYSKLGNLGTNKSDRKFDPIYLGLTNEINALYSNFTGSADEILEIRARKTALSYLQSAGQNISAVFDNDQEYSKFKEDLKKMRDQSSETLSFYEDDHGFLDENQRITLRMSDDEEERRKVSEYYSFGSTFFFANQVLQGSSTWMNLAGGMRSFAEAVKSGAILSGLRDDYFKAQEAEATGLFKELTAAAGIGSYTSADFYKDSIRTQSGADELDSAKIAEKKAELATLISGITDPQEQLAKLAKANELSSIFGLLTGSAVKQDLIAWQKEITDAKTLFETLDRNIQEPMSSFSVEFDSLLNFFNTPALAQMQGYSNGLLSGIDALKNATDSSKPIYDPVNDIDGNSPYLAAPDSDGDAVGSPSWNPTYLDANGKLPWEAGYQADNLQISPVWTPTYRDVNGLVPTDSGYDASSLKILGYRKPLATLDTASLSSMKIAFDTEAAKWNATKTTASTQLGVYRTSLNAVTAFKAAHPNDYTTAEGGTYLTLIAKLRDDGLALVDTYTATTAYLNGISDKYQELKAEQDYLIRLAKQTLGLPIDRILVPEAAMKVTLPPLPAGPDELPSNSPLRNQIANLKPENYYIVSETQRAIVQSVTAFEFSKEKEVGQFSGVADQGAYFFLYNLGRANAKLEPASQGFSKDAAAWVNSLQGKDVPLNGLAARLDSLNDRVVYYKEGAGPNQIGQTELVGVVNRLRDFLLEKSLNGVEFNPVLKELVEAAGAFTDQIENIQYLQSYTSTDKKVSDANLLAVQEAQKTLTEVSKLATDLNSFLVAGNAPAYTNLSQVQSILEKYETLKNKPMDQAAFETQFRTKLGDAYWLGAFQTYKNALASAEYFFSPATQEKIEELKANSWEMYKRNLSNAYLTQRVGNPILSEFLNELRGGKFSVLIPNQGVVSIDSKFLGRNLTEAQIVEVGDYLKPFDSMALIQRQGLIADLDNFLKDYDPDLKAQMKTFSLVNQYGEIRSGVGQGAVFADRDLPPELKDFALISAFEYFLNTTQETKTTGEGENKKTELVDKYDPKNADSRRKAMSDFLLKLGPVHKIGTDGKLVLDTARQAEIESLTNGYLANYGSKNPASYLNSQILKDFEARNAYYAEKELRIRKNADPTTPAEEKKDELSYDDLTALKSWVVEAKYDPATEAAVIEAARMDFLLSHYYGEDTEDLKAEDLAKNPELAKFYGDGGKGYFSEMDSYFAGLGQGVLTQTEKDRFNLLSSGVADAWGIWQYDPSSLISSQIVLQNFGYADEYASLVESLSEEGKRLQKESVKADSLVKKEKYVNDYRNGLIKFASYQSYLGVPTDNVASDVTTNEGLAIQGKLRELEMDAEQKLGGLFNLLETHKSYVFDNTQLADALPDDAIQTVADLNPGLRTTAKFMSSSYTLGDSILPKDGDGNYNFDGDFTNLKARLDQALNVVSPGSVDYDKYSQEVSKQSGLIGTLKNSIEMAGQSYVLLSEKLKSGVDPRAELAAATIAFETANSKIEDPVNGLKKQYQEAEALVATKQNEYLDKEKQVSDAYKIMLSAQDTFNQKAALYDYATLLNYSKHDVFQASTNENNTTETDSIPAGYIDTPKKMAKERLAAVQKEYDEKAKQVETLEKKLSSQIGVADLKSYVQNEEKEVEKWAQLTVKYNTAETLLRQKIADLKRQIGAQQAALDGELDKLWGLAPPSDMNSAGMMDSLDGSLDFGGTRYIKTENWNRDRTRITEGIIGGQLGYMDVLTAYQWEYSKGVPPEMEQYNLGNFLGRWSHELQNSSFKSLPKRANEQMNSILFPAPDTRPSRFNAGSGPDSAGKYVQAYMGALNIQTMAQIYFLQQLDLICMGMCMLTIPYVNEIQTHYNYRDQINDVVGGIRNEGIKLKNLYTELQTLTDVDDTDQLLSVLGRPEFGLTAEDLTMIGKVSPSSNGLKDLVWKSTTDTPTPLSFNDLVGSDGLRLAQQKAIHDSYGNYVRDNEYAAGNITAGAEQTDQYGRKTALMVGSDEFLDAMGVLAEAQYQVARDAYYKKAESFVKQVGTGADKVAVKVDTKVILDEREQFMSDLLKKITNTSNGETVAYNVETTIYKTVLNDYMGPTGVVSQIFGSELQQRQQQQMQQWDLKEREFYDLKSDWVQNVSYIKQTGTKRWENMVQEFQSKWTDWRTEYKTQHEANQKVFLDRIEQTLEKKETWTKDFLQKSSEVSDELSLRQMYDSIAGIVSSMQENLPTGVSVNINVNDILSNILSKKPGSISSSLIDRASSIDTNFFLNEVKKFNFNDGGVKEQFKNLMKEMDKLSQNLIILQTLESLRSLPEAFATAVKKQNEAADKQLDSTMAYGGFARMGGAYMRSIKTASGGDEIQVLATYLPFLYNPPNKFPEVKDSNGKLWDLGKADALINGDNVPSPSDLTVMVRLAKNKMSADFKKVLNPEKQRNYELELGLFDPSELLDSMNDFIEGVREGETVSCMNKTPEECAKSAMSSGFLVGEVPDGDFGFAQFGQFYQILKTKKEMDKRKAKMDQARKRKSGGMGRFYNQIGAIGEGYAEMIKGTGQMLLSGGKAYLKAITGDFDGAKKDLKAAGKAGERALQGYLYAVSGVVDFVMFAAETVLEPVVGILTLGQGTDAMNGKFAEGNYELAKFRDGNKAQRQLNELGTRTGAEMYANDAIVDKIVTTTLAVVGIVGAILSFTPLAPIGVGMMAISAVGTMAWKSFRGAYEGGAAGMAAGMVSGAINAALEKPTAGMLSVNLSYSYEGGFGAGVDVGTPSSWKVGGSLGLNYNSKTGAWGASAGVKIGLGSQNAAGDFTKSAGLTYNRNNIGRDDQSSGWNAELSGPFNDAGTKGSMSLTYDTKVGYGASVGFTSEFGPLSVTPSWSISQKTGLNSDIQYGFSSDIFSSDENPEHAAANRNLFGEILNGMGAAFGAMRLQDQLIEAQGSGSPGRLINDIEKKSLMEAMTGPGASKEKTEQLVANLEALGVDSDQLRKIVDDYRKKTGRTLMSDEERINIYNYRLSLGLDQNGMADFLYSDYYKSDRELAKLYDDLKAKTIQEHQPSPSGIEGINSDKIKNDASEHSQYYLDNKIKDKIENAKKILMEHPELISDVNLRNKFLNQSSLSASAAICVVDSDFIMLKNNGALGEDGKPLTFEEFYIKGVQRGAIKLDKNKFGTEGFFFVQDPKKLFEGYRDSNGNTFELRTEFAKKSGDSYVYDSQNQEYLKNQIRNNTNVGVVRRAAYDKSLFDFLGNSKTKYLKDDGHSYNGFVDQYGVFKPVDVAKPNRDTFSPIIRIDYLIKIAEGGL